MRILYDLCGEGMGHATRSKVVIEHLKRRGHEVLVTAPGRAYDYLAPSCGSGEIISIVGLNLRCEDGKTSWMGTIEQNAQRLPAILTENARAWELAKAFRPNAVIGDFNCFGSLFALSHHLPFVSVDNHQVLPRCEHDWNLFRPHEGGFKALELVVRGTAPRAEHCIVTSFFHAPVKPEFRATTTLVPPILRPEVLRAISHQPRKERPTGRAISSRRDREHVLVYKTHSLDDGSLLAPLGEVREQTFVVYGTKDRAQAPPNVVLRPFSEGQFITDLASAKAVVCNAGMSLLGEALAFGKPIYTVPVRDQYEQVMNGIYVAACGYGVTADSINPTQLRAFLSEAPRFRAAVAASPQHDGNARLYTTLDRLFGNAA